MAFYALLIYATTSDVPTERDAPERVEHDDHAQQLEDSGAMVAAFALQPSATATSLRGDMVTDGPFLEAKEVIAGFAIIEAADHEQAVDMARSNPATWQGGGVELRPVESFGIFRGPTE